MGVQSFMTPGNKAGATVNVFGTGFAAYPTGGEVSIIASAVAGQGHRRSDSERAIGICIDYARDNNLFRSAGSVVVYTALDGGKVGIVEEAVIANVPAEAYGIAIAGAVRDGGDTNIIENAHRQLIDVLRETDQLSVEP
jgi:hypothetical protein